MQVHISKARISDTRSQHHGKVMDLLVEDGIITRIAASIKTTADVVIAAEGLCVSPGWVDVFADYREPGYEHKETIETGLAAAAAGGFTDVLLAPNTQPAISSKSVVQYVQHKATGSVVNLHPIGAATRNTEGKELAEMLDMRANGAIAFSDGWKPMQGSGIMLKVLEYVTAFDGVVMQIPIDAALAHGGLMNEGEVSTALGMAGIPELAETLMVYRDIELVRYTGSRLHICGVSTAATVAMVRQAKADGLAVTCSVTPYHLSQTEDALRGYDSAWKVSPPLRGNTDRLALIAALADGTIDCIATHHRPHEWDAKAKELEYAAEGMAIQESAAGILWEALKNETDTDKLIHALSVAPRTIFGLPAADIAKGNKASLTLYTTSGTHTIHKNEARSAATNNPWLGMELSGKVIGIINNNKIHLNK